MKYLKRFEHLPWDRRIMAVMISAVDDGVGEIRTELERLDLLNNTINDFRMTMARRVSRETGWMVRKILTTG